MEGLEITVLLGLAVLVGTVVAPRLRVATPLVLLAIGLLLGFVPPLREIELPPETMLLLFLPVMLFWESFTTSIRSVRRSLRYIVPMSTLLVVASAFAVAGIAAAMGVPWEAALILGAAVAPPDATAVGALGRLLPRRTFMKLKAESLTNDGTALVLSAIAVSLAVGGQVTPWSVTVAVLLSYLGGAVAGIAVAALAWLTLRRLRQTLAINVTLLLTPFVAFLVAELIEGSGVLAVVFAGLIVSWLAPRITTAQSRQQAAAAWPFGVYLLNGALFVLIGLEVQHIAHEIPGRQIGWLLLVSVAAWAALGLVRFLFQALIAPFARRSRDDPAANTRRTRGRSMVVSTVAGFRGAVSLAIALSVPATTPSGAEVTGRDAVVFVTAGVILLTLLVQGPLLPAVIRWARLPADDTETEEYELAQRTISGAALAALDDLAREHGVSDEVRDQARRDGYARLELANAQALARRRAAVDDPIEELEASLQAPDAPDPVAPTPGADEQPQPMPLQMLAASEGIDMSQRSPLIRHEETNRLRLALLDREREVLLRLRREGVIDDLVSRRVQRGLDAEELRLAGAQEELQ